MDPREAERTVHQRAAVVLRSFPSPSPVTFLVGGQRGVDTWAAEAGIQLGLPVELILPLPPRLFAANWEPSDRARLAALMERASTVEVVAEDGDQDQAYRERNRRIANRADRLIAVWTGLGGGGTAETLSFFRALGRPLEELRLPAAANANLANGRGR